VTSPRSPIHHLPLPFLTGLFILDGVITIPIALLYFLSCPVCLLPPSLHTRIYGLAFPGLPSNTRPNVISPSIRLKLVRSGWKRTPSQVHREKVAGFFTMWHIWFLVPCNSSYHLFHSQWPQLILCQFRSVHPCMLRTSRAARRRMTNLWINSFALEPVQRCL